MLKKTITYTNFDGEEVTDTFYFNISKVELLELEVETDGKRFSEYLQEIVDSANPREVVSMFKKIILLAYGEKSSDGKRFIKNDELREAFSQTAAYEELFVQLSTSAPDAAEFVNKIMPKDIDKYIAANANNPTEIETPTKVEANPDFGEALAEHVKSGSLTKEELMAAFARQLKTGNSES